MRRGRSGGSGGGAHEGEGEHGGDSGEYERGVGNECYPWSDIGGHTCTGTYDHPPTLAIIKSIYFI